MKTYKELLGTWIKSRKTAYVNTVFSELFQQIWLFSMSRSACL